MVAEELKIELSEYAYDSEVLRLIDYLAEEFREDFFATKKFDEALWDAMSAGDTLRNEWGRGGVVQQVSWSPVGPGTGGLQGPHLPATALDLAEIGQPDPAGPDHNPRVGGSSPSSGIEKRLRRRVEMGKLTATTQATVDGVVDPVGEWVQADGDHGEYSFERQARSSGLVLGRKTYEGLAGYWPSQSGKWADMVNPMPKYVGSNTLSGDLEWNATLLEGDLEDSVPKLKDEVDGDLFMHGSGEFAYALAEKGLIDEYEVYVNPLVWGEGNVHVLGDRGTIRMELDDVRRFDSGVVLLTYLPAS